MPAPASETLAGRSGPEPGSTTRSIWSQYSMSPRRRLRPRAQRQNWLRGSGPADGAPCCHACRPLRNDLVRDLLEHDRSASSPPIDRLDPWWVPTAGSSEGIAQIGPEKFRGRTILQGVTAVVLRGARPRWGSLEREPLGRRACGVNADGATDHA